MALRSDQWAGRLGPILLLLLAIFYYGSYFNNGLNLGGEGGTTAVYALRLMEGQRPIVDTFLGYNLLWFYPVVWLFRVVGPDYLALRFFFFALCAITAILGFFVVRRVTRSGWLALGTGVMLVLIPGMLFRNYMGLMAVANQWTLTSAFLLPVATVRRRILLIGLAGLVLGLTFLIRIEVGLFMLVIAAGLLVLNILQPGQSWRQGFRVSLLGGGLGLLALAAVHAPFAWDAVRRGYARPFFGQYTAFAGMLRWEIQKISETRPDAVAIPEGTASGESFVREGAVSSGAPADAAAVGTGIAQRRQRPDWKDVFRAEKARDRDFAGAMYLPVLLSGFLVVAATVIFLGSWLRRDVVLWRSSLLVLVLTGCALTLFPQYYFFRPDTPHLVEFMIPLLVALVCAMALVWRSVARLPGQLASAGVTCLILAQIVVHFAHAYPKESAGTIAARKHRPAKFAGLNNVRVQLRPDRARALTELQEVIVRHSRPEDWVVCFPYSPTINFMTDRPSYLWDLYTDNTLAGEGFDRERIAEVKKYQPAVVVIDLRAINNTEASRFPNWSPVFYAYLRENYNFAGEFAGNEVFLQRAERP